MKDYIMQMNNCYLQHPNAEEYEIGKIIHKRTREDVMYLVYSKTDHERTGLHFHVVLYSATDGGADFPVVIMDEFWRDLFFNRTDIFEALVMHELGHVIHGDLLPEHNAGRTPEQIMDIRIAHVLRGDVMPEELAADRYAIQQCGKRAVMKSIDFLIQRRRIRNDPGMALAIREFNSRKKAVQNAPRNL